jgi:hypothetical protein
MVSAGEVIRASDVKVQACRATRATALSIANGVDTTIAFTAELLDNAAMHDNSTNNTRITINESGYYMVGFNGQLASSNAYTAIMATLMVNGSTPIARTLLPGTSLSVPQRITISTMDEFTAGDYIEVVLYQTSGASRSLELVADCSPVFWAARIGS